MQLVWFKKDLRTGDHPPLARAAAAGPLLALWIDEPAIYRGEDFDASHLGFANECLASLDAALRDRGGRLLRRRGNAVRVLEALWRERPFAVMRSHRETGNGISYRRDLEVAAWCASRGVRWIESPQGGVIRRLGNRDGWSARWAAHMAPDPLPAPERIRDGSAGLARDAALSPEQAGLGPDSRAGERQLGGTEEAWRWLDGFLAARGLGYTREMSSPLSAWDACSRISPYLAWGCLSTRQAYHSARARKRELDAALAAGREVDPRWSQSLRSFASRLRWRCHFMQKLEDEPELEFRNLARCYDGLRDESGGDEALFTAWAEGRTGYPMVDACMRALRATGWLNFRMRAMLMSFASHHLWLHWRRTGLHLARCFLDYEPGIHWSQCQMQSGTTAINTLRVYSPTKQLRDHDPEGRFVRRWVPELAAVPDRWLAEPWTMPPMEQTFANCVIGRDYPPPVVDHATAYRAAHEKLREVRSRDPARREADRIQRKHGSRRSPDRRWR